MDHIKQRVRGYILEELNGKDNVGPIDDDTPLLTSGLIDSISALQLVYFLEQTFSFKFKAHEVDRDNLNTIDKIVSFILAKIQV
ncbi:MAG: acyl carrier protein [Bacteroidota bacterium]